MHARMPLTARRLTHPPLHAESDIPGPGQYRINRDLLLPSNPGVGLHGSAPRFPSQPPARGACGASRQPCLSMFHVTTTTTFTCLPHPTDANHDLSMSTLSCSSSSSDADSSTHPHPPRPARLLPRRVSLLAGQRGAAPSSPAMEASVANAAVRRRERQVQEKEKQVGALCDAVEHVRAY